MPVVKIEKNQVIKKAYQLFRENGYNKTSMSDIASACGIFKSGLYHHFRDKETLMEEVLKYAYANNRELHFPLLTDRSKPVKKRLSSYLQSVSKIMFNGDGGCFFANITLETSANNERFRIIIKKNFQNWVNAFMDLYSEIYDKKTAREYAERSISDIEGGVMMARIHKDKKYFNKTTRRIKGYI